VTARSDRVGLIAHPTLGAARAAPEARLWPPLEAALRPLDAVRRWSWLVSAKTAFGRACLRDRGLRLTTLALGHMAVAATLTVVAPVWLLLLGPLVLGVPHVASDVRYLLLSPPLPLGRRGLVLILGPLLAMTGLRVVSALGGPWLGEVEVLLGAAGMLGGVAIAPATPLKKALVALAVLAITALSLRAPHDALVTMAHLHNLVAFGLWLWLFRGESSLAGLAVLALAYVAVVAFLLSGLFDPILLGHAIDGNLGAFGLEEMAWTLAPGASLELSLRVVATYAFAQSIHYAVWLRLIPQRLDRRTAPPTFRRSLSRVRGDFGRLGFALLVALSLAVPLAAIAFPAGDVRELYLLAAISHGWLELAIIAALLTRQGRTT